jgi:hypothetical protein
VRGNLLVSVTYTIKHKKKWKTLYITTRTTTITIKTIATIKVIKIIEIDNKRKKMRIDFRLYQHNFDERQT